MQPTRQRIHTIIKTNPGTHTAQAALVAGVTWNTAQHHVRTLEREGYITTKKIDGKIRLYDASQGKLNGKEASAVLQCPVNRRVAKYVLSHAGRSQRVIAESLDMSTTAVHRRVSRLEEAGLLARLSAGRMTLVEAAGGLGAALVNTGFRPARAEVSMVNPEPTELKAVAPMAWLPEQGLEIEA